MLLKVIENFLTWYLLLLESNQRMTCGLLPVIKTASERCFCFCNQLHATLILCRLLQTQRFCMRRLSATSPEPLSGAGLRRKYQSNLSKGTWMKECNLSKFVSFARRWRSACSLIVLNLLPRLAFTAAVWFQTQALSCKMLPTDSAADQLLAQPFCLWRLCSCSDAVVHVKRRCFLGGAAALLAEHERAWQSMQL